MEAAGLHAQLFAGIFPLEDQPVTKPDPRCFDPVWRQIGDASPQGSIYVGDRREDMLAARAAGITFVAVRCGPEAQTSESFMPEVDPSDILDTATDLPSWLDRRNAAHRPA